MGSSLSLMKTRGILDLLDERPQCGYDPYEIPQGDSGLTKSAWRSCSSSNPRKYAFTSS